MDDYVKTEILKILKWKAEEPGVISQGMGVLLKPAVWLFNQVVPESVIEAMLHGADWMTQMSIPDTPDSPPDADLKTRDAEVTVVQRVAIAAATGEGAVAGWIGFLSAPVDIPAVIMLSMRAVRRIGLCYGYSGTDEAEREFVLSVIGSAGANNMAEKMISLHTLSSLNRMIVTRTFKSMAERAAENAFGKEAAVIALRDLAKQIGVNLTKRKLLAAIPAIGAIVGASLNAWYLRDIGIAAQCAYQERWLRDQGIMIDGEAVAE